MQAGLLCDELREYLDNPTPPLVAGECIVIRSTGTHDAMNYAPPLPELPTRGEFRLPDFDAAITFDPWPAECVLASGWVGATFRTVPSLVPVRSSATGWFGEREPWRVIVCRYDELGWDHGRTWGKCRFGAGRVIFTGAKPDMIALLGEFLPPRDTTWDVDEAKLGAARWREQRERETRHLAPYRAAIPAREAREAELLAERQSRATGRAHEARKRAQAADARNAHPVAAT